MNLKEFQSHTIKEIRPGQFVCARPDGCWNCRFFVTEIGEPGEKPQGLAIAGDICPKIHGVISSFGKGVVWFSGDLSRDCLCEKFLQREWCPEKAIEDLEDWMQNADDDERTYRRVESVKEEIETSANSDNEQEFYSWYTEAGMFPDSDWDIGHDYNRHDADILVAIHATFRRLYHGVEKGAKS